jgi:hypothetical protein
MLNNRIHIALRRLAVAAFLASAAIAEAGASGTVAELAGFHAEYQASYAGFKAEAVMDLRPADEPNEYVYEIVTRALGFASIVRPGTGIERSRIAVTEAGFSPISYQLDDGTEEIENDTDIEFNWETGIAHSVYKGVPKDIDISAGMLDRLTADIAAIHELRNNRKPTSYEITHRNSIRLYEFTQQGEETVSVPAGKFRTVKYLRQRPGSSRATLIWFAPEADYLPVKIVQLKRGKSQIVMVATLLETAPVCADCTQL